MAHKIQIKRGNKADLPTLDAGEFGLCQDTNELFIGNSGNQKIFPPTASDIGLTDYFTAIITMSWVGSEPPYSQTVMVQGILETDNPFIDILLTGDYEDDIEIEEVWANIYRAVTSTNAITFYSHAAIEIPIPIRIKVVR